MTQPRKPKPPTRAEVARGEAEQRLLAPFMAETHRALGFWRACKRSVCRRQRRCCGNVDACGTKLAPQRWSWVKHVVAAIRDGHSRSAAGRLAVQRMLGLKKRMTIHFGFGEPVRYFVDAQGRRIWPEHVPKVQLGSRFRQLTGPASCWMRDAPHSLAALCPAANEPADGASPMRRDARKSGLSDLEHVEIQLWAKPAAQPKAAAPDNSGRSNASAVPDAGGPER
jgi:hypothetical protein